MENSWSRTLLIQVAGPKMTRRRKRAKKRRAKVEATEVTEAIGRRKSKRKRKRRSRKGATVVTGRKSRKVHGVVRTISLTSGRKGNTNNSSLEVITTGETEATTEGETTTTITTTITITATTTTETTTTGAGSTGRSGRTRREEMTGNPTTEGTGDTTTTEIRGIKADTTEIGMITTGTTIIATGMIIMVEMITSTTGTEMITTTIGTGMITTTIETGMTTITIGIGMKDKIIKITTTIIRISRLQRWRKSKLSQSQNQKLRRRRPLSRFSPKVENAGHRVVSVFLTAK